MARARTGRDDRGRLCVFGSARTPDGQRLRKRLVIPDDDEALGAETVRELNRRFALGDLSWFLESPYRSPSRSAGRTPTLTDWSERWLTEARGEIGEHTWRTYRTEARALQRRIGDRRIDRITVSDLIELRRDLKRLGRSERTVRNRLAFLRLLIRDACLAGLVASSPFDVPLPRDGRSTTASRYRASASPSARSSQRSWSGCSRSFAARATPRSGCGSR